MFTQIPPVRRFPCSKHRCQVGFTRHIIGSGIHANDVDGVALCQMFSRVISTTIRAPKYPLSGHAPDEFPIVARIPILSQS